jgi:nitroreductase
MGRGAEVARGLDPDEFAAAIRGRRSVDLFEPEPVGTEALRTAIELARWAPNHRLTEPWCFYLIGAETAHAVAELGARFETAIKGERAGAARFARLKGIPAMFVLTCRRSDAGLQEREDYAACCCAAQNLMLYLWQRGIGVKWTTGAMTREQPFYDVVGIDSSKEFVVGFFWYGRPKVVPTQKRRDVSEMIVERP